MLKIVKQMKRLPQNFEDVLHKDKPIFDKEGTLTRYCDQARPVAQDTTSKPKKKVVKKKCVA